jgi:hypothetical protein
VSGDRSSQPGPGVDVPARPDDLAGSAGPAQRPSPEPSLAKVLATTLRLWLRRRVLRLADDSRVGALRWTAVTAVVLIVAGAAGGGVVLALPGSAPASAAVHQHRHAPRISPAQAELTANEQAAAAWIAGQVAAGTNVACDAVMCTALETAGFPATQLLMFGPGSMLPPASKRGAAELVVETVAAQADLGRQLPAAAPQVLATFGAKPELVQVRVIGGSPAAFRAALHGAIAADAKLGRSLIHDYRLHLAGPARAQLGSGLVDPRLEFLLARLVAAHAVYVTGFGNANPGLASPAELRAVTITGLVRGTGKHRISDLSAVLRLLRSQPAGYRAAIQQGSGPGGEVTLTIGFRAPGPL